MLHRGSWNGGSFGEELRVGRCTVRLKRSLGEGGFAFVHLVEDVSNGRELVLKRASLQSTVGRAVYEKESSIMRTLAHPNIVQLLTAEELSASNSGAILMEYCPGGHLLEILNKLGGKRLDEVVVLSVFCDIVSAVKYLHQKGITHRDIKLENILQSVSGPLKLCDFGSCVQGRVKLETAEQRANEEEVVEKTTTQMYRAPEMVDLYMQRELTEKVDVWALGCVLFAVCYLKHPFQDAGNLGILNARIRIPEDSRFSENLKELTQRMFVASPPYRPSVAEVESCVHSLSRGHPLPPPRNPRPPEAKEVAGDFTASGSGAAVAIEPGIMSSAAGHPRDNGGRGGEREKDAGRKSLVAAKGTTTQSKRAGSKSKEPQLNPNSVAARRLASRKEAQESDVKQPAAAVAVPASAARGSAMEHSSHPRRLLGREYAEPGSDQLNNNASTSTSSADHNKEYVELCRRASKTSTGVVRPPPAPGPLLREKAPPPPPSPQQFSPGSRDATNSLAATGAGGVEIISAGSAGGWSSFADFDQFSGTPGAAPHLTDGFGAASFDTAATPASVASQDPFAIDPKGGGGGGGGGEDGDGGSGGSGGHEHRHSGSGAPLLLDLHSSGGGASAGHTMSVAALGEQLAGVFPPPTPSSSVGTNHQHQHPHPSFAPSGGDMSWGGEVDGARPLLAVASSPDMKALVTPWATSFNGLNGGGVHNTGLAFPQQSAGQGGPAQGVVESSSNGTGAVYAHQQKFHQSTNASPGVGAFGAGGTNHSQIWLDPTAGHQSPANVSRNMGVQDARRSTSGIPSGQGFGESYPARGTAGSWPRMAGGVGGSLSQSEPPTRAVGSWAGVVTPGASGKPLSWSADVTAQAWPEQAGVQEVLPSEAASWQQGGGSPTSNSSGTGRV